MARILGPTERGHLPAEREILRVLWSEPGEYLVRSEIHRRMPQIHQPTLGRVGQILTELKAAKLVVAITRRAQGSKRAAFYHLSKQGLELCRELGFEREEAALFPMSEQEQKAILTRDRLLYRPERPGKISAVCGYRGGTGRTTIVAHVARGIAEGADRAWVLVLDLDISAPGLERFFDPPATCRGLAGLALDYQRKIARKRELWLQAAVASEEYVYCPFPNLPNLTFMPSGLSPGSGPLAPTEHTEAIALLNAEAKQQEPGFLTELRNVLLERYDKTLVDPQAGRGLSAWIATQALADELVLCLRTTDTGPSNLGGVRAILATFLARRKEASVVFVFPAWEPIPYENLNRWIDAHLVPEIGGLATPPDYDAELLIYDRFLSCHSGQWRSARCYSPLVSRLSGGKAESRPTVPSGLEPLLVVLDANKSWHWRDLAAGVLQSMSLQEIGGLLEIYRADPSLHQETDELGHRLIENITRGLERKVRKILPRRPAQRHRGAT